MKLPLSNVILVSDMDDTLLMPDKTISTENLEALDVFRRLGGRFTVATGRSIPSYTCYHQQLKPDLPVILNNGAVIYDGNNNQILWNTVLPDTAKKYLKILVRQFSDVGAEILSREGIYIASMNQVIQQHIMREHLEHTIAKPDKIPDCWFKVLFAMEEDRMEQFLLFLENQQYQDVQYINSSRRYCEMLPVGSSKGHAMEILIELTGNQGNIICGAGDYYNDLKLIQNADIGFAVENAPEDVKAQADVVVCANHQHAIVAIIQYLLQKYV